MQGIPAVSVHLLGSDTALAVNEETDDAEKTPGRAAVISTILLMIIYVTVTVAEWPTWARRIRTAML